MIENVIIFVLAALLGTEVLTKVPQTLHTPLMSGANAISGITLVGAVIAAGMSDAWWAQALGFGALVVATINVVGGFLVTDRMLRMFGRKRSASASDSSSS
ncbi:pyridine nucleotide transhydrogenase [Longimonas halophila]|jgi:NAD(P) transhydrogenase subunit alpha|uniref:proton-translocating NAD(P)(+) transhydrogenase n=1 Tax=Longimonas halophila TaxID=1469170 RepID=A0A2H3NMN9_9BACT|nr:NAD(P) transhydrogenase subunit alpha [Longimonas halophila]PEN07874.1 pyridine nucleotide transhydrogenase [Longimonas halophila]